MTYTKITLKGSFEAILIDIKNIEYKGEKVYPNFPEDYEFIGDTVHDRFIVTPPRQEVLSPATFNEAGEETTSAVMGDFISQLVLPAGYDTSHFATKV
tara:strand:- start:7790 stop:8083 length:294 start_codon:yes stop_codon:yes gene_type:complete